MSNQQPEMSNQKSEVRKQQVPEQFLPFFLFLIVIIIVGVSLGIVDVDFSSKLKKTPLKSSTMAALKCIPISNSECDQLVNQMEELFENMKFSDITVNVGGREFQAHKSILAERSPFFDDMFDGLSSKEKMNQVEIEDVEPEVFHEILRFIYTGRVSTFAMSKMPIDMLAVAEKFSLDNLKRECETQLSYRMSPENCLQLLLITDKQHPAFYLREYAVSYFRYYSGFVMATHEWEEAEKDHPEKCFSILKELARN